MLLVDAHTHLDHPHFEDNRGETVLRAEKAGVKAIITSGINPETNRKALELAAKHDIVKASLGIYPVDALQKEITDGEFPLKENVFDIYEEIDFISSQKNNILAIGEIGLDFVNSSPEEQASQKELFMQMLELAEKIKKPVVVHSRKAELACVEILETTSLKNIIMHCFCGKKKLVIRGLDNSWTFSVPTNVVRNQQFQIMASLAPLSQLLTETDAPYLSPFPDKRNEPAFVLESVKKIAEIKGLDVEETANNIFKNYQDLFF